MPVLGLGNCLRKTPFASENIQALLKYIWCQAHGRHLIFLGSLELAEHLACVKSDKNTWICFPRMVDGRIESLIWKL